MFVPGTSPLGGTVWELRAPKSPKNETPFTISRNCELQSSSYLPRIFFGPWSIFWHIWHIWEGVLNPQNFAPKSRRFSPLPQTRLESSDKNFSSQQIFRRNRPLANGEESVRISAPSPELGEPKEGYKFRGAPPKIHSSDPTLITHGDSLCGVFWVCQTVFPEVNPGQRYRGKTEIFGQKVPISTRSADFDAPWRRHLSTCRGHFCGCHTRVPH